MGSFVVKTVDRRLYGIDFKGNTKEVSKKTFMEVYAITTRRIATLIYNYYYYYYRISSNRKYLINRTSTKANKI